MSYCDFCECPVEDTRLCDKCGMILCDSCWENTSCKDAYDEHKEAA